MPCNVIIHTNLFGKETIMSEDKTKKICQLNFAKVEMHDETSGIKMLCEAVDSELVKLEDLIARDYKTRIQQGRDPVALKQEIFASLPDECRHQDEFISKITEILQIIDSAMTSNSQPVKLTSV